MVRRLQQIDTDEGPTFLASDAESINRALDDRHWLRRAHSIGHTRQHLDLLTCALATDALETLF